MVEFIQIEKSLIVTQPLTTNDGYEWTLASRLGAMLRNAEALCGERDKSYTILGIEFCGESPQLWYPQNCGNIVIQLSECCMTNLVQACYQLAHECIHLLSPSGGRRANVLEEGLATIFANSYVKSAFAFDMPDTIPSYANARKLVSQLLTIDVNVIRTIRKTQPTLYKVTTDEICCACPACPIELATELVKPFVR